MDRLMALQAFARVVEVGGFTKAGDSLHLSKTTVSDLVQGLESTWGAIAAAHHAACDRHSGRRRLLTSAARTSLRTSTRQKRQSCKLASRRRGDCASICPVGSRGFSSFHDCRHSSPVSRSAIGVGDGASASGSNGEGIDCVVRFGVQPDSSLVATTSRYDDFRLLCEPCVPAGAWDPAQSRGLSAHRCVNYVSNAPDETRHDIGVVIVTAIRHRV